MIILWNILMKTFDLYLVYRSTCFCLVNKLGMEAAGGVKGHALEIWHCKGYNMFDLDEDALGSLLLDSRVRNTKVMIVSVGGRLRYGNSLLLNVFLKYLQNPGKPDWMTNPDVPLKGFKMRTSPYPDYSTKGIFMWSEPFFITTPSGEEVCVLLMDTQGYELRLGVISGESEKIHAITSLISSVQLFSASFYNVLESSFKYVTDYGKLALNVYKTKPYQTLYFLIRDCDYFPQGQKYPLGLKGGDDFIKDELKEKNSTIPEYYKDLHCYNMPYHIDFGSFNACLSDKGYKKAIPELTQEFKNSVKNLTEHLFDPKNVVIKEINGKQVTGVDLFLYFKSYSEALEREPPQVSAWEEATYEIMKMITDDHTVPCMFRSDFEEKVRKKIRRYSGKINNIPEPSTLIKATEEARDMTVDAQDVCFSNVLGLMETMNKKSWDAFAMDKAILFYRRKMNKFIYGENFYRMTSLVIKAYHNICCRSAVTKLRGMGVTNEICEDTLKDRLLKLCDAYVDEFRFYQIDPDFPPLMNGNMEGKAFKMAVSEKIKFYLTGFTLSPFHIAYLKGIKNTSRMVEPEKNKNYFTELVSIFLMLEGVNTKSAVSENKKSD